jgi:hypothetical protein
MKTEIFITSIALGPNGIAVWPGIDPGLALRRDCSIAYGAPWAAPDRCHQTRSMSSLGYRSFRN